MSKESSATTKVMKCTECGTTCVHNRMPGKKDTAGNWRCTFCGHPLGTGPKRDRNMNTHLKQVEKGKMRAKVGA